MRIPNKPIKIRFALLATRIVDSFNEWRQGIKGFFKSKGSVYLVVLCSILLFMPYIHVKYNGDNDMTGILGFKWMSSFLFALALPSVLISGGFLIRFMAGKLDKQLQYFFIPLSHLVIASGAFFLAWTFYPMTDDFTKDTYYPIIIAIAIVFSAIAPRIQKYFLSGEEQFKASLNAIFRKRVKILAGFATNQKRIDNIKDSKIYDEEMYDAFEKVTDG